MPHRWTRETAKLASQKGLVARRKVAPEKQAEYRKGYLAGWVAYARYLAKVRLAGGVCRRACLKGGS